MRHPIDAAAARQRCREAPPPELLDGIALFNRREFFECHEVLEELWRREPHPIRYLYQGILQIGVGFYHLGNGNWRGAVGLLEGGIAKARRYPRRCLGVEVGPLVDQAQRCLDRLRELGPDRIGEFDWSLVPAIALAPPAE